MWNFFSYQLSPKSKKVESQNSSQMKKFTILLEANNKQVLSKKTSYDMNVFQRFINECGEKRKLLKIPPDELDKLLCNFYINAKKKDNSEYEPDTMSSFSRSIQRYLDDTNAKINILKDEEFKVSRDILKSKRRELGKQGKGNNPNATAPLTNKDIERISEENQFGKHDPEVLSRTMWSLLTLHFGHRARTKQGR